MEVGQRTAWLEELYVEPAFRARGIGTALLQATLEIVEAAHRQGMSVRIAPRTTELLVERGEYVAGQGLPLFELRPPILAGADWAVKRSFDVVVAALIVVRVLEPGSKLATAQQCLQGCGRSGSQTIGGLTHPHIREKLPGQGINAERGCKEYPLQPL